MIKEIRSQENFNAILVIIIRLGAVLSLKCDFFQVEIFIDFLLLHDNDPLSHSSLSA